MKGGKFKDAEFMKAEEKEKVLSELEEISRKRV